MIRKHMDRWPYSFHEGCGTMWMQTASAEVRDRFGDNQSRNYTLPAEIVNILRILPLLCFRLAIPIPVTPRHQHFFFSSLYSPPWNLHWSEWISRWHETSNEIRKRINERIDLLQKKKKKKSAWMNEWIKKRTKDRMSHVNNDLLPLVTWHQMQEIHWLLPSGLPSSSCNAVLVFSKLS